MSAHPNGLTDGTAFRPSFNKFRMSGKTDPPDAGDRMLRFFRSSFNEFRMSGKTDPPDPGDRLPAHSELVDGWVGYSAHP